MGIGDRSLVAQLGDAGTSLEYAGNHRSLTHLHGGLLSRIQGTVCRKELAGRRLEDTPDVPQESPRRDVRAFLDIVPGLIKDRLRAFEVTDRHAGKGLACHEPGPFDVFTRRPGLEPAGEIGGCLTGIPQSQIDEPDVGPDGAAHELAHGVLCRLDSPAPVFARLICHSCNGVNQRHSGGA